MQNLMVASMLMLSWFVHRQLWYTSSVMEPKPHFERIIGGTEEQKEELTAHAKEAAFKSGQELFGEYLVEPTAEEKTVIEKAASYANSVAERYGATNQFDPDRIFMLQAGGVEKVTKGRHRQGLCNSYNQSIAVERSVSGAVLAPSVVHEMFHLDSYHSDQVLEVETPLGSKKIHSVPYRSGIAMHGRDKEGRYFSIAEEAIIAVLSKRFFDEEIATDSQYKDEIERTERIKQWILSYIENNFPDSKDKTQFIETIEDVLILPKNEKAYQTLVESNKPDKYKLGFFSGYFEENLKAGNIVHERGAERKKFDEVLDRIVAASEGKMADKNQLFDEFARAHFTGNYLPLARIIEGVMGEGSFRQIATELGAMRKSE
jgi:hypothetical protein